MTLTYIITVVSCCWCGDQPVVSDICDLDLYHWPISLQWSVLLVTLTYIITVVSGTGDLDLYHYSGELLLVWGPDSCQWHLWPWPISLQWPVLLVTLTYIITVVSCCWCGDQTVVGVTSDLDLYHYSGQLLLVWGPDNGQWEGDMDLRIWDIATGECLHILT